MAVHVAARIGALAQGGEILASAETLTEAGRVAASAPRIEAVRGVTVPVTVAAVDWA
jgi:class 3 adenylate cyclase